MENMDEVYRTWRSDYKRFWELSPEVQRAFNALNMLGHKEGTLTVKTKELIAVGISLAIKCIPCIAIHTKLALEAGATKEEIIEASTIAVILTGGSGAAYIGRVFDSIDAFKPKDNASITSNV